MNDVILMAVVNTLQNLFEDIGSVLLIEELLFDDLLKQLTTLTQFRNEVYILFILEVLVQFQNLWMVKGLHNFDFTNKSVPVFDTLSGDFLACSNLFRQKMRAFTDGSECTLP